MKESLEVDINRKSTTAYNQSEKKHTFVGVRETSRMISALVPTISFREQQIHFRTETC